MNVLQTILSKKTIFRLMVNIIFSIQIFQVQSTHFRSIAILIRISALPIVEHGQFNFVIIQKIYIMIAINKNWYYYNSFLYQFKSGCWRDIFTTDKSYLFIFYLRATARLNQIKSLNLIRASWHNARNKSQLSHVLSAFRSTFQSEISLRYLYYSHIYISINYVTILFFIITCYIYTFTQRIVYNLNNYKNCVYFIISLAYIFWFVYALCYCGGVWFGCIR